MTDDSGKSGSEQTRPILGDLTNLRAKQEFSLFPIKMTEDSGKSGSEQTRPGLGDLTNLPAKRELSSILGDLLQKSESGAREKFSKRLCLVVDDLVKESAKPFERNEGSSSDYKISSGDSDNKEEESEEYPDTVMELSSGRDGKELEKSKSLQIYTEPGDKDSAQELNTAAKASQKDVTGEGLALSVLTNNPESVNRRVIGEELPGCKDLRSFELSKCLGVKRKEHVDQIMGDDDLLKGCSCSFCYKAAFIWSDLQYQDTKGRLSALKKSQKHANTLIQRNCKDWPMNSISSEKQETNFMSQWGSLFVSMGNIINHENNDLQNRFEAMRKYREDCKMDLERAMKIQKHNS